MILATQNFTKKMSAIIFVLLLWCSLQSYVAIVIAITVINSCFISLTLLVDNLWNKPNIAIIAHHFVPI